MVFRVTHVAGEGDGGRDPREGPRVGALVGQEALDALRLSLHALRQEGDVTSRQHADVAACGAPSAFYFNLFGQYLCYFSQRGA